LFQYASHACGWFDKSTGQAPVQGSAFSASQFAGGTFTASQKGGTGLPATNTGKATSVAASMSGDQWSVRRMAVFLVFLRDCAVWHLMINQVQIKIILIILIFLRAFLAIRYANPDVFVLVFVVEDMVRERQELANKFASCVLYVAQPAS
jgi:hypothetical protein